MTDAKPLTAEELALFSASPMTIHLADAYRIVATIDALRSKVESLTAENAALTAERDTAREAAAVLRLRTDTEAIAERERSLLQPAERDAALAGAVRVKPLQVGDLCRVNTDPAKPWTFDWRNDFVQIVGITAKRPHGVEWDGVTLDYAIVPVSSPKDGYTDGFEENDLSALEPHTAPTDDQAAIKERAARMLRDIHTGALPAEAPQPQQDPAHAARLYRLLLILQRLKWTQGDGMTLKPSGPDDALNDLGLFMLGHEIDMAIERKDQPAPVAVVPDGWVAVPENASAAMQEAGAMQIAMNFQRCDTAEAKAMHVFRHMLKAAPPGPAMTEAQAGAKVLREMAKKLVVVFGPFNAAESMCCAEADRLDGGGA